MFFYAVCCACRPTEATALRSNDKSFRLKIYFLCNEAFLFYCSCECIGIVVGNEGLNSVLDSRKTSSITELRELLETVATLGRDSTLVDFYPLTPTKPRHLASNFHFL